MESKEEMSIIILEYLDKTGQIPAIQKSCIRMRKRKDLVVFNFPILIDTVLFLEKTAYLGNLILQNVVGINIPFQQVVFSIIKRLHLLPESVLMPQISVTLRLTSLPSIPEVYNIQSITDASRLIGKSGYVKMDGIICGMTAPSLYTQSTKYFCPEVDCDGHYSNEYIRVHIPGASEAQTVRKDFYCLHCGSVLLEDKKCRTLSDKCIIEVFLNCALKNSDNAMKRRFEALPVYVRDDLTKLIKLGQSCTIIGLLRKDVKEDKISITIEANNLILGETCAPDHPIAKKLPANMVKLYEDRKSSSWSFASSLAYLFGAGVSPPGSFIKLKLGLMLSIVSDLSSKVTTGRCLHVLAIGKETIFLQRLLQYSQKFATRSVVYTTGHQLAGRVTSDKYDMAKYFVECGTLLLAERGVCQVGDISRFKKPLVEKLQSGLDSGHIVIDVAAKFTGGLPQQLEFPLSCSVWGYSNPLDQKKAQTEQDDLFLHCDIGDVPRMLLDAFGMVYFTDDLDCYSTSELTERLAHFTLTSAMSDGEEQMPVTDMEFMEFFSLVRCIHVTMPPSAEALIQGYYLASRKVRSTGENSSGIPLSARSTLYSLACSHAKLSLRTEVSDHDALLAIRLYEEMLTARFGYSVLSIQLKPHYDENDVEGLLGKENDLFMQQFHSRLLKFCSGQSFADPHVEE